MMAKATMSMNI